MTHGGADGVAAAPSGGTQERRAAPPRRIRTSLHVYTLNVDPKSIMDRRGHDSDVTVAVSLSVCL